MKNITCNYTVLTVKTTVSHRGFSAGELGFCAPRQDLMIPVRSSVAADAHLFIYCCCFIDVIDPALEIY